MSHLAHEGCYSIAGNAPHDDEAPRTYAAGHVWMNQDALVKAAGVGG